MAAAGIDKSAEKTVCVCSGLVHNFIWCETRSVTLREVVRHEGSKKCIWVLFEWERRQLHEEEFHHFILSPNILVIEPSRMSVASILSTGLGE